MKAKTLSSAALGVTNYQIRNKLTHQRLTRSNTACRQGSTGEEKVSPPVDPHRQAVLDRLNRRRVELPSTLMGHLEDLGALKVLKVGNPVDAPRSKEALQKENSPDGRL